MQFTMQVMQTNERSTFFKVAVRLTVRHGISAILALDPAHKIGSYACLCLSSRNGLAVLQASIITGA
jgi:uncharacterized protein YigA (DUF484 family)